MSFHIIIAALEKPERKSEIKTPKKGIQTEFVTEIKAICQIKLKIFDISRATSKNSSIWHGGEDSESDRIEKKITSYVYFRNL